MSRITPCLWFDTQAEEAATFYTGVFPNASITKTTRYGKSAAEIAGMPVGSAVTVAFELDGQPFFGLNGGPAFTFSEAISFSIRCDSQQELDRYWEYLLQGSAPQQCGWLKDKFGVSWQVVPAALDRLLEGEPDAVERVMAALLKMIKLDIATLEKAYEG